MTGANSNSKKLLLVDDERDIVNVLKIGLEKHGFSVDGFTDPQQALDHFKPDYYDQILTDVRMPIMSGFDFARHVWAKDPNADICFLSSFEIFAEEAKKVFSNLSSHCFIKKPIAPSALAKHIEEHAISRLSNKST